MDPSPSRVVGRFAAKREPMSHDFEWRCQAEVMDRATRARKARTHLIEVLELGKRHGYDDGLVTYSEDTTAEYRELSPGS
jgi:hypothetical protein